MSTQESMTDLLKPDLKRAPDRNVMGNDALTLRALADQMNREILEEKRKSLPPGAKVTLEDPEAETQQPKQEPSEVFDRRGGTVMTTDPVMESAAPATQPLETTTPPQPTAPVTAKYQPCQNILFTGRSKTGKTFLAEQLGMKVVDLNALAEEMAGLFFPGDLATRQPVFFRSFVQRFRQWGAGVVSDRVPLDMTRLLFLRSIGYAGFGAPNFWATVAFSVIAGIVEAEPKRRIAVEGIETPEEYDHFVRGGFRHYHVMASNLTLSSRGGSPSASELMAGIDGDVTRKISAQRTGPKLWCVWSDPSYPPVSSRLLTVQEFLSSQSL